MLSFWIGNKISVHRKIKKMTQEELGVQIGLSRASVVNIENGKQNPSIEIIWKIASVLEIKPEKLLPLRNEHITLQYNSKETNEHNKQLSEDDVDIITKWMNGNG